MKQFFYLLFPTKELAGAGVGLDESVMAGAVQGAKWYSEYLNCNVSVVEENTYFVLLEVDGDYYKLLDCNGNIGWIYCFDFSGYFELVKE